MTGIPKLGTVISKYWLTPCGFHNIIACTQAGGQPIFADVKHSASRETVVIRHAFVHGAWLWLAVLDPDKVAWRSTAKQPGSVNGSFCNKLTP